MYTKLCVLVEGKCRFVLFHFSSSLQIPEEAVKPHDITQVKCLDLSRDGRRLEKVFDC